MHTVAFDCREEIQPLPKREDFVPGIPRKKG